MVWGAIVGTVCSCLLGAVWYSTFLFGNPWMRGTFPGKTSEQILKSANKFALPMSLISQAILVIILQHVMKRIGVSSKENSIYLALTLAVLETLVDVSHCAFSQRSLGAFVIDHGYNMGVLVIMAVSVAHFC